ncbi:MAG: hypothetical protein OCD00_11300 [Colwellia sp.]
MPINILPFISKSERDSKQNIADFINYSKNKLTKYKGTVTKRNIVWSWELNYWIVNFTKLGIASNNKSEDGLLHEDIMDFSKAYLRYQQSFSDTNASADRHMKAIRCIEKALLALNQNALIINVNGNVFDEAVVIAKNYYSAPHQAGLGLEQLCKFLNEKNLIPFKFSWKSSTERNEDDCIRIGPIARKRRAEKLPNDEALDAIAEIFSMYPRIEDRDIFTTSILALLLSSPDRISEIFHLPVSGNPYYGKDTKGITRMGLRWYNLKEFDENMKWIPTIMEPVVIEAIERIKKITEPARRLAKLYEENPNTFPLHSSCPPVDKDILLTKRQCALALGMESANESKVSNVNTYLRKRGVLAEDNKYSLQCLLPTLRKSLPKDFPIAHPKSGIKWSDSLFCMFKDQLAGSRPTNCTTLWMATRNTFSEDLKQSNKPGKVKQLSIFERYDYPNNLKIKSHQPRHLLSTLAKEAGMEDDLLADWAGRANSYHNRAYDNRSPEDRKFDVNVGKSNVSISNRTSALSRLYEINPPKTKQEINLQYDGTIHFTEFGYCEHDFIVSPCSRHRDCLNCSEHTCVKGEIEKENNLRQRYELEQEALKRDEEAISNGKSGASRHYKKRLLTIKRIEELLSLYDKSSVEDGSQIKLVLDDQLNSINKELSANNKPLLKSGLNVDNSSTIRSKPLILNRMVGYSRNKNG